MNKNEWIEKCATKRSSLYTYSLYKYTYIFIPIGNILVKNLKNKNQSKLMKLLPVLSGSEKCHSIQVNFNWIEHINWRWTKQHSFCGHSIFSLDQINVPIQQPSIQIIWHVKCITKILNRKICCNQFMRMMSVQTWANKADTIDSYL